MNIALFQEQAASCRVSMAEATADIDSLQGIEKL